MPLWQSVLAVHPLPAVHAPHPTPPQSTSVSVPFFTLSVQDAAAHAPSWHTPELQSLLFAHCLPVAHAPQPVPPMRTVARLYAQVRVVPFVFPRAGPDGRRRGRDQEQLVAPQEG